MIKIKKKLKEFISMINILPNFNIDVDLKFFTTGLSITSIHTSGNSICLFEMDKLAFDEYDIVNNIIYTLNVEMLKKIVKRVGKKELEIEAKEDGLYIRSKIDTFKINYYVGKEEERKKPEIETSMEWEVDTKEMFDNVGEFKEFSDVCRFENKDNSMMMKTKSNLVEGHTLISSTVTKSSEDYGIFDLTYFANVSDIKNIFKKISFGFGKNTPCIIKANDDGIKFEWILAPRVEDG